MYYLQSRYYNPKIGRFINADVYVATGQGLVGNNMFAYCNNCPISFLDTTGTSPHGKLTLLDYYLIHKLVQMDIVDQYGLAMEVYVWGQNQKGYLDLYDPETNTFYEVKSKGAASTAEAQMQRYEQSRILDIRFICYAISGSPSRGSAQYSGRLDYGNYSVTYTTQNGLVIYDVNLVRKSELHFSSNTANTVAIGAALMLCATALGLSDRDGVGHRQFWG